MTEVSNDYKNEYKISVIVPVFRVESYLPRCIDSIIGQTYTNLEIILVDDGSDDRCPEICEEYAQRDKRIKVIHKQNGGLSSARNEGIKAATGDLIALVDSDDFINENMFSDLVYELVRNDADIAMCDYKYVFENDICDGKDRRSDDAEVICISGNDAQYMLYRSYEDRITYTVAWNKIYKKKLFDGISYPDGRIHEDEARTHELCFRASKIAHLKYPYYYYYQRSDSIVGKTISRTKLDLITAYIDKLRFYREHNENDLWGKEVMHAIHMVCYLQSLYDEADINLDIVNEVQVRNLTKEIKIQFFSSGLKPLRFAEVILFILFPRTYIRLWKRIKANNS